MVLPGNYIQQILDALLSGYRSEQDIEMMIRMKLSLNLRAIAGGKNLQQIVFKLIEWAEAHGMLESLIYAAHEHNPNNQDLQVLAVSYPEWRIENEEVEHRLYQLNQADLDIQDQKFSEPIRAQMEQLNKVIENLTSEQFRVIDWLRGHRRAAIAGCAGSGKTLVAVEKAIRLDHAGLRTLILCHNPNLSRFIQQIVVGTTITVFDFNSWIARLNGQHIGLPDKWTNYHEPTQEEIDQAFDNMVESGERYDAIIVDEAQDFRYTWWLVVEASLGTPNEGILFLFHDDNQALLPMRSKYPIQEAPFLLSKNCRNAGNVYEVIKRLHNHAPESSLFLANQGVVKHSVFDASNRQSVLKSALEDALEYVAPNKLVILTLDTISTNHSFIDGLFITQKPAWDWQKSVKKYLEIASSKVRRNRDKSLELPKLSAGLYPTEDDIFAVSNYARQVISSLNIEKEGNAYKNLKWFIQEDHLNLNTRGHVHPYIIAQFFSQYWWAEGIPEPHGYNVVPHSNDNIPMSITLYDIPSFKGLEADGIVLFARTKKEDMDTSLYVGLSRARYYLHLVLDEQLVSTFSRSAWFRYILGN